MAQGVAVDSTLHDADLQLPRDLFTCPLCKKQIEDDKSYQREEPVYGQQQPIKHDLTITLLECPTCERDVAVSYKGYWTAIDDYLSRPGAFTGVKQVTSESDSQILYVLSQICHNQYDLDLDRSSCDVTSESPFLAHPQNEFARIMWLDGQATGFYTLKQRGCMLGCSPFAVYQLDVVDTIYVRKAFRGRGLGSRLIRDAISLFPDRDLGFSSPVSDSLLTGLFWMMLKDTSLRERLWECSYDASEGYRCNIWLQARSLRNVLIAPKPTSTSDDAPDINANNISTGRDTALGDTATFGETSSGNTATSGETSGNTATSRDLSSGNTATTRDTSGNTATFTDTPGNTASSRDTTPGNTATSRDASSGNTATSREISSDSSSTYRPCLKLCSHLS